MTKRLPVSEDILVFAFRYALGRRTGAPSIVVAQLKQHWSSLHDNTKTQIQREIKQAIDQREAGDQCDEEVWAEVLDLPNGLPNRSRAKYPAALWRVSDGERFSSDGHGVYTMDTSRMALAYRYTYDHLMSLEGEFSKVKPKGA